MLSQLASATVSLRILAFVTIMMIMMMPMAALGYSNASDAGIKKNGAGLVLLVSLQRQSMQ